LLASFAGQALPRFTCLHVAGDFPQFHVEAKVLSTESIGVGLYSRKQVLALTTLSPTTLWREVNRGAFPKPVRISPGRVGFPRTAVDAWLEAHILASTSDNPMAA
jgi:prophage regulatory protein